MKIEGPQWIVIILVGMFVVIGTLLVIGGREEQKAIDDGPDIIGYVEDVMYIDDEVTVWLDNGQSYTWNNYRDIPIREGQTYEFYIHEPWFGRDSLIKAVEVSYNGRSDRG